MVIIFTPSKYQTEIVGEANYQKNIKNVILFDVMVDDDDLEYKDDKLTARLVLDNENQFDPDNAVRIEIENKTVGYLDKQNAARFRRQLKRLGIENKVYLCQAVAFGKRDEAGAPMSFGIWLKIDIKDLQFSNSESEDKDKNEDKNEDKEIEVENPKKNYFAFIVVFLILAITLYCASTMSAARSSPSPTSTPQQSAWTACSVFIDKQLGIDFMEAQRYTSSGVTELKTGQYQVEIYYAKYGSTYQCIIQHTSSGWQLLELNAKN